MSEKTQGEGMTKEQLNQRLEELLGEFSGKPPWHEPDAGEQRARVPLDLGHHPPGAIPRLRLRACERIPDRREFDRQILNLLLY